MSLGSQVYIADANNVLGVDSASESVKVRVATEHGTEFDGDRELVGFLVPDDSGSGKRFIRSWPEANAADECYVRENTLSIGARLTTTTDADGNVRLVDVVGMSVVDAGNGTPDDSTSRINALKATFSDLDYDAADIFDSTSMVQVEHDNGDDQQPVK